MLRLFAVLAFVWRCPIFEVSRVYLQFNCLRNERAMPPRNPKREQWERNGAAANYILKGIEAGTITTIDNYNYKKNWERRESLSFVS
jgi:hypothetical protein